MSISLSRYHPPLHREERPREADYSLDWRDRPLGVQHSIQMAFQYLRAKRSSSWTFNGRENYHIAGIKEDELLCTMIRNTPDRHLFYVLDVGAGNFQWGRSLAKAINNDNTLPRETQVIIINIRGETYKGQPVEIDGCCTLVLLGAFKIEELFLEFKKRQMDLEGRVDLILSRWCFRHLVDPVGTFAQTFSLLRPNGMLLFDGFFFLSKIELTSNFYSLYPCANLKMIELCAATKAKLLTTHFNENRSLNHFVLQRIGNAPLRLNMHYLGTCSIETYSKKHARIRYKHVTLFDSKLPSLSKNLHMPKPTRVFHQLYGDENLFRFLREEGLFTSPAVCYHPLYRTLPRREKAFSFREVAENDRGILQLLFEQGAEILI